MKVELTKGFIKVFQKRFANNQRLKQRFKQRIELFSRNSAHPLLRDHALGGDMQGKRAFSVTGDIRVVYIIEGEIAYFIDIGTHNQVY